jgi:F-type H+-transporting ATPase subunit b
MGIDMLRRCFIGLLAVVLGCGLFAGELAARADQAHDAQGVKSATEGHADAHTEKPALLHWDFGSAFWSIIVFLILLIILRFAAWKPILAGLHNREKFITESIAAAKRERLESERMMREYTDKMNKARDEATAIVEEGRRDAEALRRKIHEDTKKEAAEMLVRAQREIKIAKDTAVAALYQQTVEIATNLAGRIVRKELTPADHRGLLDESLAELSGLNRKN